MNSYIVYANSPTKRVKNIEDHTQFEALENHVHLIDRVKKHEYPHCVRSGSILGKALLDALHAAYPERHFVVFVTVRMYDSLIIRFHQKWDGELPYYDPDDVRSEKDFIIKFEN